MFAVNTQVFFSLAAVHGVWLHKESCRQDAASLACRSTQTFQGSPGKGDCFGSFYQLIKCSPVVSPSTYMMYTSSLIGAAHALDKSRLFQAWVRQNPTAKALDWMTIKQDTIHGQASLYR